MNLPLYYGAAPVLIGVLVLIHEFGHFLVARLLGVQVRVFSVGFGPRLFGIVHNGTDYRLSAIPFGGYVRMAGADPFGDSGTDDEDPSEAGQGSFMARPPWQRLAISLAGPIFNLILPFVVFTGLYTWGEPQSESVVGSVRSEAAAEKAGFIAEDRLVSINGEAVRTWVEVDEVLEEAQAPLQIGIERGGTSQTLQLSEVDDSYTLGFANAPSTQLVIDDPHSPAGRSGIPNNAILLTMQGQSVRSWNDVRRIAMGAEGSLPVEWCEGSVAVAEDGTLKPAEGTAVHASTLVLDPNWQPQATSSDDALWKKWGLVTATLGVDLVSPGSAAEAAGVRVGDRFLALDGTPIRAWGDVLRLVAASATGEGEEQVARAVKLSMRRQGEVVEADLTPRIVQDTDLMGRYRWRPMIGVGGGGEMVYPPRIPHPYPLPEAARRAAIETTTIAGLMVEQIGKLITGEAAIQKSLGGPIEIMRQAVHAAERGLFEWARQLALLSISLGVLNLLPVPVLDGGQVLMYFLEWVRGRPLPLRLRELALQGGVIFLVLLTLLVMIMDIHRAVFG